MTDSWILIFITIKKSWILIFQLRTFKAQIHKLNQISTQFFRPPLATYSSLCSTCVTYGMPCHAIGHQLLPTVLQQECYGFERAFFTLSRFLPYTPLTSKLAGHHIDLWDIAPGPAIHLNHNNPQKRYGGRFYLRVTGWPAV